MSEHDAIVARIADLVGIADRYRDQTGALVETGFAARRAVLEGLGLEVAGEGEARDALERVAALKNGLVPALIPIEAGRPFQVPLGGRGDQAEWRIREESGAAREGRATAREDGAGLTLPALPQGYHRLQVRLGARSGEATLIAAPRRCWEPRVLREGARLWGTTAQIYALRSARNLGIGDYADVADLAAGTARFGASFLGLSPVHALFSADRSKISPYSPSSRLFLETIFIDPASVDGFAGSAAARLLDDPAVGERLSSLREAPLVDHAAVWELKRPLLEALWDEFRRGGSDAFESFRRAAGEPLEAHATFEALAGISAPRGAGGSATGPRTSAGPARPRCDPSDGTTRSASPSTPGCNGSPTGSSGMPRRGPAPPAWTSASIATSPSAPMPAGPRSGPTPSASRRGSRSARRRIRSARRARTGGCRRSTR